MVSYTIARMLWLLGKTKFIAVCWQLYIRRISFSFALIVFLTASNYFYYFHKDDSSFISYCMWLLTSETDTAEWTEYRWMLLLMCVWGLVLWRQGLNFEMPPTPVSQILGLQACNIMPRQLGALPHICVAPAATFDFHTSTQAPIDAPWCTPPTHPPFQTIPCWHGQTNGYYN